MNAYEEAADRFNAAAEKWDDAKTEACRILREARAEYDAAEDELRRHESKPGIPLPEYRHWNEGQEQAARSRTDEQEPEAESRCVTAAGSPDAGSSGTDDEHR